MKKLFFIILTCKALLATSLFTLDNVNNLRIYFVNETEFITKKQADGIKEAVQARLKVAGFTFGSVDAATFFIKVESIDIDETEVIYVQIGIGEEVITNRVDKIETFAFTYLATDFIEADNAYFDTVESVHFLIDEFLESYKDDNQP